MQSNNKTSFKINPSFQKGQWNYGTKENGQKDCVRKGEWGARSITLLTFTNAYISPLCE